MVIDNFITQQIVSVTAAPVATGFNAAATASALGVERDILVTKTVGFPGEQIRARTNPFGATHLRISQDAGVRGTVDVVWDGIDGSSAVNASGLGGLSLLADGSTAFALRVGGSDVGGPVQVTLFQQGNAANTLSGTFTVPGGLLASQAADDVTLLLPFTSLTLAGTASANDILTSVGAIRLRVDGSAAAQEAWDSDYLYFRTVPEPMTLGLIAIAGLAVAGLRRRSPCHGAVMPV